MDAPAPAGGNRYPLLTINGDLKDLGLLSHHQTKTNVRPFIEQLPLPACRRIYVRDYEGR
jgi:hypothetical protein